MSRKRLTELAFLLLLSVVWFAIGWVVRGWRLSPEVVLVEQVRQRLLNEYPGQLPSSRELTYAAIRGMLDRAGDPYAALLEPEVSRRFWDDFAGESGVIGVILEPHGQEITIAEVVPGGPAEQTGLRPGDVVLSVDGVALDDDTVSAEVGLLMRGPVGTAAEFEVRRDGERLQFAPVREEWIIVAAQILDGDIAYLNQYAFTTNAPDKVKAALQQLLAQNPKALIWDLRSNGGGSMDATQDVLSYFIEDGLLFLGEVKGGQQRQFMAEGEALAPDIPMVVLIGGSTYSSGETAAATISERERGLLMGQTTYGKGKIQTTVPLVEDALLQFTVAEWLSPSGESYDGRGVTPDITVSDDPDTEGDEVLQFALDYVREELVRGQATQP